MTVDKMADFIGRVIAFIVGVFLIFFFCISWCNQKAPDNFHKLLSNSVVAAGVLISCLLISLNSEQLFSQLVKWKEPERLRLDTAVAVNSLLEVFSLFVFFLNLYTSLPDKKAPPWKSQIFIALQKIRETEKFCSQSSIQIFFQLAVFL